MMTRYAVIDNDIIEDIVEIDENKNLNASMSSEEIISSFFPNKKIILETTETGQAITSWIFKNDKFIMPSPYPSWILNEETWMAPKKYPCDNNLYYWDENKLEWIFFKGENA